jgi:chorismate dehydratase
MLESPMASDPSAPETPRPAPLRVGSVPYLVGRPLDLGLEGRADIELTRAVPAELVEGLRAGRLDVALVSSIELFRRPGYGYLDGLAVLGDGPVSSVQLFLRRAPRDLRRVALDPASRTSAVLVRIVLAERFGVLPEFVETPPGRDPRAEDADAWLRIGDPALRERLLEPELEALDPSSEWRELTGMPFPFACWIVAPGVRLGPTGSAFHESRRVGAAAAADLARGAAREMGLPLEGMTRYLLEECRYDPGQRLQPALERLRDLASAVGACEPDLEPRPIRP